MDCYDQPTDPDGGEVVVMVAFGPVVQKDTPPRVCGATGCQATEGIHRVVDGNGRVRALCPECAKDFLRVSS